MPSCSCFIAVGREFNRPMFDLAENTAASQDEPRGKIIGSVSSDAPDIEENPELSKEAADHDNGRRLDIVKTFSPLPRLPYIAAKLFFMAWIISIMVLSIRDSKFPSFWLAYLTHWGVLLITAYAIMSFVSAIYLAVRPPTDPNVLEGGVGFFAKATWTLFAAALPFQVVLTILFWVLEFDGDLNYVSFMVHGGGLILITIDGFFLSRIPLRAKQFIFFELLSCLYILWSVLHAFSGIGNPYVDIGDQTDDAVYNTLAWRNKPVGALILAAGVFFVANPLIYLFCWTVSWLLPRRCYEANKTEESFGNNFEDDEAANEAVVVY